MGAALATSHDGQWAAIRDGGTVRILAGGAGPPVAVLEQQTPTPGGDAQLAWLGPPTTLAIALPDACVLVQPPRFEPIARLPLAAPARLAAVTGSRCVLVGRDDKVSVIRVAARAAAASVLEVGPQIEAAVGLERDQVLFIQPRQLAVWDTVSGRLVARLGLELPPPPRVIGIAAGHLWAHREHGSELVVYRLSDGRPFSHSIGGPIRRVVSHPATDQIVVETEHGIGRIHAFAHSASPIDVPGDCAETALALLVAGADVSLLGVSAGSAEPWRVPLASRTEPSPHVAAAAQAIVTPTRHWRETLVAYAHELARGEPAPPSVAQGSELGELAHRLALSAPARRALTALYAAHLIGAPEIAIARLARATDDWTEALGRGELTALGMLRRAHGKVALHDAIVDVIDGAPPRAVRLVGDRPAPHRPGAFRVARDGRTDAEIEAALAAELGRIAIVTGPIATALVEARLRDAIAVAFTPPPERPHPWPRDAGLVLVLYGSPSSWVADLPTLTAS